ncbi:MAG: ABC transporter ATP-binding protein [Lachnospiraceae bacterium]|nr:ABC transporter ATP-binding protein [Lachnospiraceae bacterium]
MIEVKDLSFSYTKVPFISDINFRVREGEIFGFLGPSGAGKSTLQKILTGLCTSYSGSAKILGVESRQYTNAFYENIGVDFEFPSLYEKLTARENLRFFASLYKNPTRDISELLDSVGLLAHGDKKVKDFSKGMKSRLNFIKALIHDPKVLFLDEPTNGLDPNNAQIMKELILAERDKGKTIIITTHNMQDATELCDRVVFIVDGQMKALDTPRNFIMSRGATRVRYTYTENQAECEGATLLTEVGSDPLLQRLIAENRITSIHSSEPTLNDVFIELTGARLC